MSEFEYDVFISYSSKDRAWVRGELLERIEKGGLRAFIDFRDFNRGAPSIKECERGVLKSRKTLLVLTPNYLKSGWGEFENVMAQTLDPPNDSLRLIPLLKEECDKPLRIGTLTHVDFRDGEDHDLAWRQLLQAMERPLQSNAATSSSGRAPALPEGWFLENPYPMPPNFTGRVAERRLLTTWLSHDPEHPLLSLRALGGFGKSSLVWHWLTHDVDPAVWRKVVWWSFYEGDANFETFLANSLAYLSCGTIDPARIAIKDQIATLLQFLRASGVLLVLDGFERALRAFGGLDAAYQGDQEQPDPMGRECTSRFAEGFLYNVALQPHLRSKVLLTTRLCPRVLEAKGGGLLHGCREIELLQMDPEDAVDFFIAQKIRGTRAEINAACAPYGYHPLSLRLLAGMIVSDLRQPRDIAAASHIDVSGDLVQRQHHVLEAAYDSLSVRRRVLLGRIACFRTPMKYEALLAIEKEDPVVAVSLDADLHDLVVRGLLHHDADEKRFDLHPIVRRYAYDRLAAPDRAAAHSGLRDYFAAVPRSENVVRLEDLAHVIELYHHTLRAGQPDEACNLYNRRLAEMLYYRFGAYQLCIDLLQGFFVDGDIQSTKFTNDAARSWVLCELANCCSLSGQPHKSRPLYEAARAIDEKRGSLENVGVDSRNLADDDRKVGELRSAEANLRRSAEAEHDGRRSAIVKNELGLFLAHRGAWEESRAALAAAKKVFKRTADIHGQSINESYRAILEMFRARSKPQTAKQARQASVASALRALELADEFASSRYPVEQTYIKGNWVLGAAYRLADDRAGAERHLHEALKRCRRTNMVDTEADILIDLARLSSANGCRTEAQELAEEALGISARCGYVLQSADAHIELARLASAKGDRAAAIQHARDAHRLATCDGPPDFTYRAAYDEAGALLKSLGARA